MILQKLSEKGGEFKPPNGGYLIEEHASHK